MIQKANPPFRPLGKIRQALTWVITWFTPKRRQDAKVVILCLLAATIFWFLNALNREYSTRISCPIRFNYDDSTYIAVRSLPTQVRLSVTGYGWNLLKKSLSIDSEPIEYTITKPLRTKYITAAFLLTAVSDQLQGLRINYVVEDTLHLYFDRRMRKTVRLTADSANISLDHNYVIAGPITMRPAYVTFEGPASSLSEMSRTLTVSIPASQIDEDYDETIEVPIPEHISENGPVTANVHKVEVSFPVEALVADSREVRIKYLHFPIADTAHHFDQTVRVSYHVRERDALRVNPADFSIVADYKNLKLSDSTIVLFIEREPFYIRNVTLDNPYIQVKNGR